MKARVCNLLLDLANTNIEDAINYVENNFIPKEEVKKVVEEVEVIRSMIQWDSADEQVYLNGDLEDMRYKLDDLYNSLKKLLEQK